MNIIEAIKSGRNFKHPTGDWIENPINKGGFQTLGLPVDLIVSDDWEVEAETKELLWDKVDAAYWLGFRHGVMSAYKHGSNGDQDAEYKELKETLGFKD
jgi:hypothetical protein